jgi:hypothetical protein
MEQSYFSEANCREESKTLLSMEPQYSLMCLYDRHIRTLLFFLPNQTNLIHTLTISLSVLFL